jgi:hypothetical protein
MSPDSVPSQYSFSLPSKLTIYSSFPAFCCGAINASISDLLDSFGASAADFTQHSNDFSGFVTLMSPLLHQSEDEFDDDTPNGLRLTQTGERWIVWGKQA